MVRVGFVIRVRVRFSLSLQWKDIGKYISYKSNITHGIVAMDSHIKI